MSRCRGCDAEIVWAVTKASRPIPLDAAPNPDGNVVFTGETRVSSSGRAGPECDIVGPPGLLPDDRVRHMPHHATCPDVDTFRR